MGPNPMKKLLFTIILATFSTHTSAQDFDKGFTAFFNSDFEKAWKELKPLAEKGHANAQQKVGTMYEYGYGSLQDYTEALKWYKLSARGGYFVGQYRLAEMYKKGLGIPQNNILAHVWFNIASVNGQLYSADYRDKLAELMSPNDVLKAQEIAKECMKSDYNKCGY